GRIHPDCRMNYLASPPLVVAYALAGSMDVDLVNEPLGHDEHGAPVFLHDVWPSEEEIASVVNSVLDTEMFRTSYATILEGDERRDFNSDGSRRGNHEVMMRGTFANVRLRNRLAPGTEGGFTVHLPDGEQMPIFDASVRYAADGVPLVVLAGKEYGSGSSRDWAAKGSQLLGIRAVLVESFERIHRSNLVGMGVLPLEFLDGASVAALGLTGR